MSQLVESSALKATRRQNCLLEPDTLRKSMFATLAKRLVGYTQTPTFVHGTGENRDLPLVAKPSSEGRSTLGPKFALA